MAQIGFCCNTYDCIATCPDHVAEASYNAVVGAHTMTLLSPEENCDFIGSSCIVETPTVTNSWTDTSEESFTFSDIFTCSCADSANCCNGSQEPGNERAPATTQLVQTAYTRRDKWKRWEQLRESVTVQLQDAGAGNLRLIVTVLKEVLYIVGSNTVVRGGYRVATVTYCTPSYFIPDDPIEPESFTVLDIGGTTLPEIPCSISYGSPVWDSWPAHPDPNYPPCPSFYFYTPPHPGCEFVVGPSVTYEPTLETESIGPFNRSVCVDNVCVSSTFNTQKVKARLYEQSCGTELVYGGMYHENCYGFGVYGTDNYRAFGYYYYYSDPFPCDAFPANPIALKREPYTDIAATTTNVTVCGQTFPYRTPAVPKDLTITLT